MPPNHPTDDARPGTGGGPPPDRFAPDVLRYLDGTLDDAGVERLNRQLRADPARRDAFVRLCIAESVLHEELAGAPEAADPLADADALFGPLVLEASAGEPEAAPPLRPLAPAPRAPAPRRGPAAPWIPWAAVLVLAAGTALLVLRDGGPARPRPRLVSGEQRGTQPGTPERSGTQPAARSEFVATLVGHNDARWDGPAPDAGTGLEAGRVLTLAAGCAELRFAGGTRAIVEGPSRFTVLSPTAASLARGRMSATVVSSTFVVETPAAHVTDLGTEFGVEADAAGTRVDVFTGKVAVRAPGVMGAAGPPPLVVAQGQAASASGGTPVTDPGGAVPQRFVRSLGEAGGPRALDVVDLLGGGDGTGGRRDTAIDPATGQAGGGLPQPGVLTGDGAYRRIPARPVVDGCFVPDGKGGPVVVSSAGHTFAFPATSNTTHFNIWAGGRTALSGPGPSVHFLLGGTDYGAAGRAALVLHSNKGLTLDLAAVRRLHPGRAAVRFRCVAGNSHPAATRALADAFVLVDGRPRFERRGFVNRDGAFAVDVPLQPGDRFLTLAVTDGGDDIARDWVLWADPIIDLSGRR